eukprot:CAMPEP_0114284798 /NCGR_PEP_ID=MMETSP0059-20121206/4839_1 /TAXON_ID=36894 /ORGANISM="Pyramimonas parkeae, Strain CCMP726" /LENGTH=329 /DNA_ID=CAMNT_0001405641 /DNA_START=130 /DNA_END=1119 /DNA_ORIENTATION=+
MSKRTIDSFFVKPVTGNKFAKLQHPGPEISSSASLSFEHGPSHTLQTTASTTTQPKVADASATFTREQNQRMRLNKGAARAKLALAKASAVVEDAKLAGQQPSLRDLLIESSWKTALEPEFSKEYFRRLEKFVHAEWSGKTPVYPPQDMLFRALNSCPFKDVRVVILGQDPYHGPNQAMGLCFSVPRGEKVPSSLNNMYKELVTDLGCSKPNHGDLHKWATQGVLLLNTALSVRQHQANSHAGKGWEQFTDAAIRTISTQCEGVVFMLWGNSAKKKESLIDSRKHVILKAAHPSGLSASRGYFGCKHFSQANKAMERRGGTPIEWQIDS